MTGPDGDLFITPLLGGEKGEDVSYSSSQTVWLGWVFFLFGWFVFFGLVWFGFFPVGRRLHFYLGSGASQRQSLRPAGLCSPALSSGIYVWVTDPHCRFLLKHVPRVAEGLAES